MVDLRVILKQKFGFDHFRPGQQEIIKALLNHEDVLAVLPTGGGKTLLYQLYAIATHQRVIIVSPLISLMQDQVSRLQYLGSKRVVALTSAMDFSERRTTLQHLEQYQFIYASPEMLSNPQVSRRLQELAVGLLVVDEAHCISEWGPDFRPDYLKLGAVRKALKQPLTLMMTATATQRTRNDIIDKMAMDRSAVTEIVMPVNRANIFLSVAKCENQPAKNQLLMTLVDQFSGAGIVYFSSKAAAEQLADLINAQTGKIAAAYHAGMDNPQRFRIQQQFMNGDVNVICATSAFGMGIDKNNVRFVIHYHMPGNVQNYMQEIGRAGRDSKPAVAVLLSEPNDQYLQQNLIENNYPDDDTIRYLFKHPKQLAANEAFRVIQYYYDRQQSADQTIQQLQHYRQMRRAELQKMIAYIDTVGCRRKFLLSVFDEPMSAEMNGSFCCDFHNPFWQEVADFNHKYLDQGHDESRFPQNDWRTTLNKLFLLKN
ncbi:RecQ family ATP-dependent DNA helicase [Lentilactobacillus parafarraginis]|uniref:ATP-dependent DNA helicase RecQ n=1 Tax=Lentilactobacillus parafarraginis DSM 18390 = JCM 14109 TaxID=1423786 RepID=A0A0R1YS13_9LACO|nr:RecQ family ATP-dependent DNA helicase [Lentilactobacillus parafarraginis]KRM43620.1 ATP-dependent DNA helicase, RecQ family [Lentilactobacillus parafarraginis DSM 18390 = JCM 14109]